MRWCVLGLMGDFFLRKDTKPWAHLPGIALLVSQAELRNSGRLARTSLQQDLDFDGFFG